MEEAIEQSAFKLTDVQPFELAYEDLNVVALVDQKVDIGGGKSVNQKVDKVILRKCTGIFKPNTFNAIVGPSGCGKTTMLNLLSGRLLSTNLTLDGKLFVNGVRVSDIGKYGEAIGYVMQQDLLMPTFSPRESFHFVANLRLPNVSTQQKTQRVEDLLKVLGLTKCSDTYVGNTLIRGISGGEKKRTSIGIELLINPSIIFLDQPTTGLDSTTALHLIKFLNKVAKAGRTIISTIHQPSSQIFSEFDRLLIMVQGMIVYQGGSRESIEYFRSIGYPVNRHSNPTDYYMKIMNKEGISMDYLQKGEDIDDEKVKQLFQQRVAFFNQAYKKQRVDFKPEVTTKLSNNFSQGKQTFSNQCYYVFNRAVKNQIRNPMDLKLRLFQCVVQAVVCVILFYKKGQTPFAQLQNILGCLFFMLLANCFGGIISNIATFSAERPIFIRERMNNSYSTLAYYTGRSAACIPLELFLAFLFVVIAYFPCNLDNSPTVFFLASLANILCYWMSASYGIMISTLIKRFQVAQALVPVLIIPLMLVAGYFISLNSIPKFFYWLEYISPFKFGFQALVQNQFRHIIDCGDGQMCNILTTRFKFPQGLWLSLFLMFIIGLAFRVIAFFGLVRVSSPQRVKLPLEGAQKSVSFCDKLRYCCGAMSPFKRPVMVKPVVAIQPPAISATMIVAPTSVRIDNVAQSKVGIQMQEPQQGNPRVQVHEQESRGSSSGRRSAKGQAAQSQSKVERGPIEKAYLQSSYTKQSLKKNSHLRPLESLNQLNMAGDQ